MWSKKRKLILMPLMVAVLLVCSIAGTALADEGSTTGSRASFLETVASELGITVEQLRDAFKQARANLKEIDPADRVPGDFKDMVEDILFSEYGVPEGALQTAIDVARAEMQARLEAKMTELRTRLQTRMEELQGKLETRRAELQARLQARMEGKPEALREKLQTRLETRMEELQGKLETRRVKLQTQLETRAGEMQGRLERKAGLNGPGAGNGPGN